MCAAFLAVLIVAGIYEQHHSIKYQYRVVDDFSYQTLKEDHGSDRITYGHRRNGRKDSCISDI